MSRKVIDGTSRTEVRNEVGAKVDVTKNYSRLPKSNSVSQPNDAGEPVVTAYYNKMAKPGIAKGGIKY